MKANVVSRYRGKSFRTVDVPDEEITAETTIKQKLELVFRYGQNEFQPQDYPSVSMGDIIIMPQDEVKQFYIVEGFGFKELSDSMVLELRKFYEAMENELTYIRLYDEVNEYYRKNNINAI